MSSEISSLLPRLEPYFLPADSPAQLEVLKEQTPNEKKLIEDIKKVAIGEDWTF